MQAKIPSFTGVLRESSILKIGAEEHLLDIRNWSKFMFQVLLSFDSRHRQTKTKKKNTTANIHSYWKFVFWYKTNKKKDNKVDLLAENTWASFQLLSGHCLTNACPSWPNGLTWASLCSNRCSRTTNGKYNFAYLNKFLDASQKLKSK